MSHRGSEWSKWDLHVHTPASLVHNYPGADPWEAFLEDLEALPPEIKVLGINDYLFLDGYQRVLEERAKGRLSNIALVLPVVELRVPQFGGTKSQWSRVNLHVIFDPALSVQQINDYFLVALVRSYRLSPEAVGHGLEWNSHPTREALEELGRSVIESVPLDQRSKYGPALIEGFNNLNVTLEAVDEALRHHLLKGRAITAVGKTEWADVKWQDGNIAEKKNTINKADFVFISSERPADAIRAREQLAAQKVNSRLLDCSDAHWLSTSTDKDRIGRCATWIKGDHTFRALRYARLEYENRVYIGDMPQIFSRTHKAPGKFIDQVVVRPNSSCPAGKEWFNAEVKLNSEMACIIGNKGSGKSAFLDIVGLAANSRNADCFSFLRPERFRKKPLNPARWFDAEIRWLDGRVSSRRLSDDVDHRAAEEVRYLPQSYLEGICNEVAVDEDARLDKELKRIIFECLPHESRLGSSSLDELIKELREEHEGLLDSIRSKLSRVNGEIIDWEPLELPSARASVASMIESLQARISQHDTWRPKISPSPAEDGEVSAHLRELAKKLEETNVLVRDAEVQAEQSKQELAQLERQAVVLRRLRAKVADLQRAVQDASGEIADLIKEAGLPIECRDIIELRVQLGRVDEQMASVNARRAQLVYDLDPQIEESLAARQVKLRDVAATISSQMSEPMRLHLLSQEQMAAWEKARSDLVGSEEVEGSLRWLEARAKRIERAGSELHALYDQRRLLVSELAEALQLLKEGLRSLYEPAQATLSTVTKTEVPIRFDVELEARGFAGKFLEGVHQGMKTGYQGQDSALRTVEDLLASADFNDPASVAEFVEQILIRLRWTDVADGERVDASAALKGGRSVSDVYDWVSHLQFVSPVFRLMFDGKSISLLSPGQRGMVLLLFYLLIDPEDIPLLVDQPEENLDNQTVASYLTDAFRAARARRQVLVVTHNANLAVVCDADQIIVADRSGDSFSYEGKPLEESDAVEKLLNILEGTRQAFDVRGTKYNA